MKLLTPWRNFRNNIKKFKWWQLAIFVAGIFAVAGSIMALFIAVGDGPGKISISSDAPVGSEQFMTALAHTVNAPIVTGGNVDILINGDKFLDSLLKTMDSAQHSINFMVFVWTDGDMSDQIIAKLLEKQKSGVQVRLMLDSLGSNTASGKKFDELRQAGAQVEHFRSPRFGKLTRYYRRNHSRSIVIDGAVGYTGGMATEDVWLGDAQDKEHWRDTMFKVDGPMAQSLQSTFAGLWAQSTGEILTGSDFYPEAGTSASASTIKSVLLNSSPTPDSQPLAEFVLLSIYGARQKIYITTPYFIPDKFMREALIQKAHQDVDVRILVPAVTDQRFVRWASQSYYAELLKEGVKIYEYQPTFIHAKTITIDGQWSIIGSANMNSRSREMDEEDIIGVLDKNLAGQLENNFNDDLKKSKEITAEQWAKEGIWTWGLQHLFRLFDKQY